MNRRFIATLALAAGPAAFSFTAAAQGAPAVGQGYIVDGRCVTLTQVSRARVSYEWRDGDAYGNGYGPPDMLGERCRTSGAAKPAAAATRPPTNNLPAQRPATSGNAQPGAPATAEAPPAGGFAQEALQAHNRLRCLHGAPPLQWSPEVAAYAQRWAEARHPPPHSDSYHSPLGALGENVAEGYSTVTEAITAWYDESKGYDYAKVRQRGMTGHFTALIWKGVRYVGCGRQGDFISCNYFAGPDPAQCASPNFNMDSCTLSQVLPPTRSAQACP